MKARNLPAMIARKPRLGTRIFGAVIYQDRHSYARWHHERRGHGALGAPCRCQEFYSNAAGAGPGLPKPIRWTTAARRRSRRSSVKSFT